MQKFLIALFVGTLIITSLLLGVFFYYKNTTTAGQEQTVEPETESLGVPKARLVLKPFRQIQALFIKVELGKVYFMEKLTPEAGEQSLDVEPSMIYVCTRPQETKSIILDLEEPHVILSIAADELNQKIEKGEQVLISTIERKNGQEQVNFLVAAKCFGL